MRKGRDGHSSVSSCKQKKTKHCMAILSFLTLSFSCSSFLLSYPTPLLLPSFLCPDVCCPWRIDCCIVLFCQSFCSPSALCLPLYCTAHGITTENPWSSQPRSWLSNVKLEHGSPREILQQIVISSPLSRPCCAHVVLSANLEAYKRQGLFTLLVGEVDFCVLCLSLGLKGNVQI